MFKRYGVLLLLISVVESGCNSSSPGTPSIAAFSATTYSGSISDSYYGAGALTVTLTPVQGLASGTWSVTYAGKAPEPLRAISGPVSGSNYTAQVTTGSTDFSFSTGCTLLFTGTLTATRLSGSYQRVVTNICPPGTGTIDVTRQ
jgi:hypothetical protein